MAISILQSSSRSELPDITCDQESVTTEEMLQNGGAGVLLISNYLITLHTAAIHLTHCFLMNLQNISGGR
jgi:F420-dependent methylenetetrahydromethanopterin dehydrogenase